MSPLPLQGPRLRLRSWRPDDLDFAVRWNNDPVSLRWGDAQRRDDTYRPWTREEVAHPYCVVSARGYAFIGFFRRRRVGEFHLTFNGPKPLTGRVDLVVAPEARGQGLGREGVALCAEFAFRTLGLRRRYAYVQRQNSASERLFRSLACHRTHSETDQPIVLSRTAPLLELALRPHTRPSKDE